MSLWRTLWKLLRGRRAGAPPRTVTRQAADTATVGAPAPVGVPQQARSAFVGAAPATAPVTAWPRPGSAPDSSASGSRAGAPDRPIETPPEPARPVDLDAVAPPAITTQAPLPGRRVEALPAPARTAPDAPFNLPDYSHLSYPSIPGGFAGPSTSEASVARRQAGRSRFSPGATAVLLDELSATQRHLDVVLRDEPVVVSLPARGATTLDYDMATVPADFYHLESGTLRTLAAALPTASSDPSDDPVDALDRLELTRLVALLLQGLHDRQHFTSRVDLESFAFGLHPRPTVALLRGDLVRRVGGDFLTDAKSATAPSMDNDRHGFALLARTLLDAHDHHPSAVIVGLDAEQTRKAHRLWARAAGPVGTRPQLTEWLAVLR
jgi:hypothetical protein